MWGGCCGNEQPPWPGQEDLSSPGPCCESRRAEQLRTSSVQSTGTDCMLGCQTPPVSALSGVVSTALQDSISCSQELPSWFSSLQNQPLETPAHEIPAPGALWRAGFAPRAARVPHGVLALLPSCFSCSETMLCSLSSHSSRLGQAGILLQTAGIQLLYRFGYIIPAFVAISH